MGWACKGNRDAFCRQAAGSGPPGACARRARPRAPMPAAGTAATRHALPGTMAPQSRPQQSPTPPPCSALRAAARKLALGLGGAGLLAPLPARAAEADAVDATVSAISEIVKVVWGTRLSGGRHVLDGRPPCCSPGRIRRARPYTSGVTEAPPSPPAIAHKHRAPRRLGPQLRAASTSPTPALRC
jgi:hypothetical protein